VILCGHYHDSHLENSICHVLPGKTTCVNVGQPETAFHYANLDFKYAASVPSHPSKIIVRAFPWQHEIES
jgi:Icc-related predicted phosphoesterase